MALNDTMKTKKVNAVKKTKIVQPKITSTAKNTKAAGTPKKANKLSTPEKVNKELLNLYFAYEKEKDKLIAVRNKLEEVEQSIDVISTLTNLSKGALKLDSNGARLLWSYWILDTDYDTSTRDTIPRTKKDLQLVLERLTEFTKYVK